VRSARHRKREQVFASPRSEWGLQTLEKETREPVGFIVDRGQKTWGWRHGPEAEGKRFQREKQLIAKGRIHLRVEVRLNLKA